eukprot:scaffold37304_cov18-Tisochrysis_lutea.AAC.4
MQPADEARPGHRGKCGQRNKKKGAPAPALGSPCTCLCAAALGLQKSYATPDPPAAQFHGITIALFIISCGKKQKAHPSIRYTHFRHNNPPGSFNLDDFSLQGSRRHQEAHLFVHRTYSGKLVDANQDKHHKVVDLFNDIGRTPY